MLMQWMKKCVKVSRDLYSAMSRCASSEAWSVTGLEEVDVNMGNNIQGATCMHEPETSKRRQPFVIGDLAAEGELESLNLEKRCKDPRRVGSFVHFPQGRNR